MVYGDWTSGPDGDGCHYLSTTIETSKVYPIIYLRFESFFGQHFLQLNGIFINILLLSGTQK